MPLEVFVESHQIVGDSLVMRLNNLRATQDSYAFFEVYMPLNYTEVREVQEAIEQGYKPEFNVKSVVSNGCIFDVLCSRILLCVTGDLKIGDKKYFTRFKPFENDMTYTQLYLSKIKKSGILTPKQ